MTKSPDEAWGWTRKMDLVHKFRKGSTTHALQCIHRTGPNDARGWMFAPEPDWDPDHPLTCPDCKKKLENEKKIEELARPKRKTAKV